MAKKKLQLSRTRVMGLALLCLVTAVVLVTLFIALRPRPKTAPEQPLPTPEVFTLEVVRGDQPVRVRVYGTARAEEAVELRAPYSDRVKATEAAYDGNLIPANEPIWKMRREKLNFQMAALQSQRQSLTLEKGRLERDQEILKQRVRANEHLLREGQAALKAQEENYTIQERLYERSQQLHERDVLSDIELWQSESALKREELLVVGARRTVNEITDGLYAIRQELNRIRFELSKIPRSDEVLEFALSELADDGIKSEVAVPFPSQVIEVVIDTEQEVTAGTVLGTVRSRASVELPVTIPDSHFGWLYNGGLIERVSAGEEVGKVDVKLVNQYFDHHFGGATIKAVGADVTMPTRSLPITLRRDNPSRDDGSLIAADELRPGMYCEVILKLDKVPNAFTIPRSAIQEDHRIFHLIDDRLHIIDEVEQVYEGPDGVIVRLPDQYCRLKIIVQPLKYAGEGLTVIPRALGPDDVIPAPISLLSQL